MIELYNRDRLTRLLVIDAIERIEIAARSAWVQEMSIRHGAHCYLDPLLFRCREDGDIWSRSSGTRTRSVRSRPSRARLSTSGL
ncbi:MAG: Abi family protein [Cyanobium sp.]